MMRSRLLATAALLGLLAGGPPEAPGQPALGDVFADGSRWCFVGDELTARGGYLTWLAAFATTRFPERRIAILNAGVIEDTPRSALARFDWDVAPDRPTALFLVFAAERGDADNGLQDVPGERDALVAWAERARAIGAALWFVIAPGSGEPSSSDAGYVAAVRQVAAAEGTRIIDLNESLALLRERTGNTTAMPAGASSGDAVETHARTDALIAWELLKHLNAPAEVASLTIDLRAGRFAATNSAVERVLHGGSELTFLWTARALPFPIAQDLLASRNAAPDVSVLSRELLQVSGLAPGRWALFVDGNRVGEYSSEAWALGINLATEPETPQFRQARDVMRLLETHQRLVAENLRSVALVEHRLAPEAAHPVLPERMAELLSSRLGTAGDSERMNEAYVLYENRKARQLSSSSAAARLWMQAHRAAQPLPHLYLLRRLP